MNQPYSDDDLTWARGVMEQYRLLGVEVATRLIKACREKDSLTLSAIASQLHERHDLQLQTMVLGQLTSLIVAAQRAAAQAHGPLTDAPVTKPGDTPPWQTAIHDQCEAALEEGDLEAYAGLTVDGLVRSLVSEPNYDPMDRERVTAGLMHLDHSTLLVLAAEMLLRLVSQALEGG